MVIDNVIQQLHTTLTHLSVSSVDRYEAEAPIIMDLVKYLLRQKQQLAINKEKIGSTPANKSSTTTTNTEAPKVTTEPTKNITDANGRFPSKPEEPVPQTENTKAKEEDDFLNKFEMPGKFAVPEKTALKKSNTGTATPVATVKTEKPKDAAEARPAAAADEATIMYDSPELAAAAANGAAATAALPKKRKLDDSDEGGSRKKYQTEL